MKKIIFLLSAVFAMTFTSCVDDLNQRPVIESDSESVYSEAANYKMVLAKLYASYVIAGQEQGGGNSDLSSVNGYDFLRGYFNLQEAGTDEVASTWLTGDNIANLTYMKWDVNDPWVSDTYYRAYYTIALCNELIRHCGESEISKFSSDEQAAIRGYKAEARFLRALSYYFVLDLFGQGPFTDENSSVSVSYTPPAYTGKQLFDYIESELKDNVENDLPADNEYGRATKAASWALLAKMYLNAEVYTKEARYTDCITYCKKIIGQGFSLEKDYSKLFNADNDKRTNEIIFSFVVDSESTVSWGATTYIVSGQCGISTSQDPAKYGLTTPWGMFRVRGELPDKFGDVASTGDRRAMFYTDGQTQWFDGAIDNEKFGYLGEKWSNLTDDGEAASNNGSVGVDTDYPMFRLADVYLMAAESVIRGGSGYSRSDVLGLLNELRERAYGDDSGNISDAQMNLQYIIDERARELWWECTRRTDLIRFGMFTGGDYIWQWKGGVSAGRSVADKFNIYPIPASELTANPNLKNENY